MSPSKVTSAVKHIWGALSYSALSTALSLLAKSLSFWGR